MLEPRWVLELPPPKKSGAGKSDFKVMPCVKADVSGVVQPPREALSPLAGFAQLVSALAYGNKPDARSQSPTLRGTNPPPQTFPTAPKPWGCLWGALGGRCGAAVMCRQGWQRVLQGQGTAGSSRGGLMGLPPPRTATAGQTAGQADRRTGRQAGRLLEEKMLPGNNACI